MNTVASPRNYGNGEFIQQFLIKNLAKRPRYLINLGLAFGLAPAMALATLYHRHNGPDIVPRLRNANCEPWNDGTWDNKQYRFYSPIDHANYLHPRPQFKYPKC